MILSQNQATAIHNAMVQLKVVGGILNAKVPAGAGHVIQVSQSYVGSGISVAYQSGGATRDTEWHANLSEFAESYDIK